MIPAEYYEYIYIGVLFILVLVIARNYNSYNQSRLSTTQGESLVPSLLLSIIMILFIGTRPISIVFCDTVGYANAMQTHDFEYVKIGWNNNFLFVPLMALMSSIGCSPQTPLIVLCSITVLSIFFAVRRMFPKDTYIVLLVVFISFTMFARMVNGLKAGCATGLIMCSLAYRDRKYVSWLFLLMAYGFHHSMQMVIAAYVVCSLYKKTETYMLVWGICLLLAVAHIQYFQFLFGSLTDESGASYLLSTYDDIGFGGRTGFRLDFVLFSAAPVLVGYYSIYKKNVVSEKYSFILNMYLVTNAVWMLCMYAPYTNRIAEISWGLYPIALVYPFLNETLNFNQYQTFSKVASYNALFSFFMTYVYYSLIHLNR